MCGRFTSRYSWRELQELYGLSDVSFPQSNFQPRFNLAPTQLAPVVRLKDGRRELAFLKWGLVPSWSKDMSGAAGMINAKAETLADKPEYRSAFRHRRCLVVADGFYEWKKVTPKEKQPYFFTLKDNEPFALAGMWESWIPREGPRIETFAIATCAPNSVVMPVHDRMPVILSRDTWKAWLGEELVSPERLKTLLKPFASERMECWAVDKRVGNVANDEPQLVLPL